MEELFLCGEFARICNLPKKTVQYYDEIGLLRPAHVGENGYRFYTVREVHRAGAIRALHAVGLSLQEIRAVLEDSNLSARESVLLEQQARLDAKIRELEDYKLLLKNTCENLADFRAHTLDTLFFETRAETPIDTSPLHGLSSSVNIIETSHSGAILRDDGTSSMLFRVAEHGVQPNDRMPAGRYCCCYLSCTHTLEAARRFFALCAAQHVPITGKRYFFSVSNSLFEIQSGTDLLEFLALCPQ